MAYYRINRDGREITVQSNMSLAEMSESYKDELIGECNQYGFLLGVDPELSAAMQAVLKRFKRDDSVTNRDIGLGKIDWASIKETPKYFNGLQRDITLEGNVVETPIKETDMTDPTGLKFGNATNVQFTVEDGVTRLVYDAGGRRHLIVRGNGECSMMSIPLEALERMKDLKGVTFRDSVDETENNPVAPAETAKTLRKELLGKLNQIRNVTYRSLAVEQHLSEDHLFALDKQYLIARSYLKKQLRKELLDTDNADNIFLDVAQQGTFRVLRMNDEADWTLIAGVAFKDYNWVITQ